jgi:hypothetical protein
LLSPESASLVDVSTGSSNITDIDGDGRPDILLTGADATDPPRAATLYLGDGQGEFTAANAGLAGVAGSASAVGDVNGDGNKDLLISGRNADDVPSTRLYLGDGEGTFTVADAGLADLELGSVSIADVNGDGSQDLLLTGRDASEVPQTKLYVGDGQGGFSEASAGLVDVWAGSASFADFDGDGATDLVIAGSDTSDAAVASWVTEVYLGDGQGGFTNADADLPGIVGGSSEAADLNKDGSLDLVLTGFPTGSFAPTAKVYLGDGQGGFTEAGAGLTGVYNSSSSIADFDQDGNLDLLLTGADAEENPTTTLYLGDGNAGFKEANEDLTDVQYSTSSAADIGNEGAPDVLVAGQDSDDNPSTTLYRNSIGNDGNYVLQFDGTDNVAVDDADDINTTPQDRRTIEAWFKAENKGLTDRRQVIYEEGGRTDGFNVYVYDGALYVGAWSESNGWNGTWLETTAIQDDQWHHVALTFDASSGDLRGYLDGVEFGVADAPAVVSAHSSDIGIGAVRENTKFDGSGDYSGDGDGFGGAIDEVHIWNRARSASAVEGDRFRRLSGSETDLVAYWPFDEGGGDTTADATNRGHEGTLNGPDWVAEELPAASAPVFTSSPVTQALVEGSYEYGISATDPDGGGVSLQAVTLPSWMTFADEGGGEAVLSGTPSSFDEGTHSVVLVVEDEDDNRTRQSFDVRVTENYALQFESGDDVSVENARDINTTPQDRRTIEAWVKIQDASIADRKQIIYEEGGVDDGFNLYVYDGALYVGAWSESNGWDGTWLSTTDIQSGTWHHVALAYDAPSGTFTGYLDGVAFDSASAPATIDDHTNDLGIGALQERTTLADEGDVTGGGHGFAGTIDEVRIWNRARSASAIDEDRFGLLAGTETDLVAYWPFNEGSGSTATDVTGRGHDGTVNGAEWRTVLFPGEDNLRIVDAADYASSELQFTWNNVNSDATYRLELATARDSNAVVQTFDLGPATSHTVDATTLQEEQAYYARVLGSTDGGATYEYRSGFTDGVTVDRTPPTVSRPVGQLTDQADVSFSVTGSDNTSIGSYEVQISDDEAFGSVVKEARIEPGESVVYDGTRGTTYYARVRAVDAAGQESSYSEVSVGVTIPELPDLAVSSVDLPDEGFSGQPVQVTWTVTNEGNAGTNVPTWHDVVYLSEDDNFNANVDTRLGRAENVSFLDVGDQYSGQAEVTLPQGIDGDYHLFVRSDGESKMAEADESNNASGSSISVELSPYPDLEVTDLQVPASPFSGDTVQVSWTVTNNGTGPADLDEWTDSIFLSPDSTLTFNFVPRGNTIRITETLLQTRLHQGVLSVDSSYTASAQVPLPVDATGNSHLFVYADMPGGGKQAERGEVYEYTQELDNWRGDGTDITLTPPPDLTVTNVQASDTATSGGNVELTWTVENAGPGDTPARSDSWNEAIYYSPSATFDSSEAQLMRVVSRTGGVPSDSSYTQTRTAPVPDGVEGNAYFFVRTDWSDDVFEHTFEDNNQGGTAEATSVELSPYPDLQVSELTLPSTDGVVAGAQVEARYTVQNEGTDSAEEWRDSLYVSPSDTWNPDQAQALTGASSTGPLAQGGDRERALGVSLPADLSGGTYYLYAVADAGEQMFELPDTTANVARSGAFTVESYPPIDLAAGVEGISSTVDAGATIEPAITITNEGEGRTRTSSWVDAVHLSRDTILDDRDHRLAASSRDARLDAGASYPWSPALEIPNELSGEYQLLVVADDARAVGDADRANNTVVRPLTIQQPAPSDLTVTSLEADSAAQSGQPMTVRWTVENQGSGGTRDSSWYDALYLSRDPSVSRGDVRLGIAQRTAALSAGATYTDTSSVDLPLYASGAYYVLVQTDRRDDLYEHQAEDNNVTSVPIELTLPAPSNLEVAGVTPPDTATPGQQTTVEWTVENTSSETASGTMREGVFISEDATWDLTDPLLGMKERTISLEPGQSVQQSLGVDVGTVYKTDGNGQIVEPLPGVSPGDYHVIVRTDIANNIRETDDGDNARASSDTTRATVPTLAVGGSKTFALDDGEGRYVQVTPTVGKDLRLAVAADQSAASNALYVAQGRAPTAGGDFDHAADAPFTPEPSLIVPSVEETPYYVLVKARQVPGGGPETVTLSAEELGFTVTDVTPETGGQSEVTTTVRGAGFREDVSVYLADEGEPVDSATVQFENTTELTTQWTLSDVKASTYDVVVERADGTTKTLSDAFTVEPAQSLQVSSEIQAPSTIRAEGEAVYTVVFRNESNVDVPYLHGVVRTSRSADVEVESTEGLRTKRDLWREVVPADSASQVRNDVPWGAVRFISLHGQDLRPGETAQVRLQFSGFSSASFSVEVRKRAFTTNTYVETLRSGLRQKRSRITANPDDALKNMAWLAGRPDLFRAYGMITYASVGLVKRADVSEDLAPLQEIADQILGASESRPSAASRTDGSSCGGDEVSVGGGCVPAPDVPQPGQPTIGPPPSPPPSPPPRSPKECQIDYLQCQSKWSKRCGAAAVPLCSIITASTGVGGLACGAATFGYCTYVSPKLKCRPVLRSCDPNDIIGPDGPGDENWVRCGQPLAYKIRFENDPERATAPAQVAEIRHPLDEDVDARSFELGSFGFGDFTFEVPEGRASYSDRLDVTDSLGVYVDVTAGLDVQTNEAFWRFTSIDPETGSQPTDDPTAGFLPINDSTGRGEGFVRYRVRADSSASTGNEIEAQADIVFDQNEPIETPAVVNTIDADDPQSNISVSPDVSEDNAFQISWQGTDPGAGVDQFQLYVAEGASGQFEPYESGVQDTSLVFVGEENQTYRFYTRATDLVGNREPPKTMGDTTETLPVELANFEGSLEAGDAVLRWTTASETRNSGFHVERSVDDGSFEKLGFVEGEGTTSSAQTYRFRDSDLPFEAETLTYRLRQVDFDGTATRTDPVVIDRDDPRRFALHPNYPNPPTQRTTIPYEVAQPSQVDVRLYDVLGRQVMSGPIGRKDPGRYTHVLDVSRFASGVYFFELRARQDENTLFREVRKITVVK